MKSRFRPVRRAEQHSLNELNITPLLDLVFVLLVIFIITTPQLTNSLEIHLPSGKPQPPKPDAPKPKINRVFVEKSGTPRLDGIGMTLPELKAKLTELKSANRDLGVVLEGDDDVDYQHVVSVLDLFQQLEITKVGLATAQAPPTR